MRLNTHEVIVGDCELQNIQFVDTRREGQLVAIPTASRQEIR
jgi:hypothetical protein